MNGTLKVAINGLMKGKHLTDYHLRKDSGLNEQRFILKLDYILADVSH